MRIDDDGFGEFVDCACELREHKRSASISTGGDEFLGNEIHPVAEGRYHEDIGSEVQGHSVLERIRMV